MTYPCPFCQAPASAESGCARCRRGPDADAIAVVRADAEIAELTPQLAAARVAVKDLEARIGQAWGRRHAAAARVRASVLAARPTLPPPAAPTPFPAQVPAPRAKEASTRLVQNALFLLGGLLLGIAAIVFTAVAWAQFGVAGRAALLAVFTAAALAVPPLALRRRLTATAETFAAVGVLLTLLDGYAAWYVNLFGVADGSPWGYAGAVFAVTAAVAAGYAHLTGLTGPRLAALLLAQPVLPLLVAPLHPSVTGWAFTFAGVAAIDLAILTARRTPSAGPAPLTTGPAPTVSPAPLTTGPAPTVSPATLATGPAPTVSPATPAPALAPAVTPATPAAARPAALATRLGPAGWAATGLGALATAIATMLALAGLSVAATPARAALAGAALVTAALLVLAATFLTGTGTGTGIGTGTGPFREVATALLVIATGIAAGRWATLLTPGTALLRVALVALIIATVVTLLPSITRRPAGGAGARYGALFVVAGPTLVALALTADAATRTLGTARPFFHAALDAAVPSAAPTFPAAVAVLATALLVLAPARWRHDLALVAAAAIALALPASLHLLWWTAPILNLFVAAVVLAFAVRHAAPALAVPAATVAASPAAASPAAASGVASAAGQVLNAGPIVATGVSLVGPAVSAAVSFAGQLALTVLLAVHSLTTGFGRPAVAAGVLGALAALGLATALLARRPELRAAGLLTALLALPTIAWTTTAALATTPAVQSRAVLAATVLLAALPHLLHRRDITPMPEFAALIAAALLPFWALLAGDPVALYAAGSLLLVAPLARGHVTAPATGASGPALARAALLAATAPAAISLLVTVTPSLTALLITPYDNVTSIWSGDLLGTPHVPVTHAVAVFLTAIAAAVLSPRFAAPVLALAVPTALAAADAPWPAVPAAALLIGLAALIAAALAGASAALLLSRPPAIVIGVLLTGSGLAGALPTRPTTLAALGAVLVAATVAGAAGRSPAARLIAWPTAVTAAVALAATTGAAAELDLLTTAFLVLIASAAALAVAWLPLAGRPAESRAVEAAGHAGAVLALVLGAGSTGGAAAVCTLWGLALGVRAMQPAARDAYLIAAAVAELAAWFLLMITAEVATLEAYTIPAALVALTVGLIARRRRPRLGSWAGYGPALAAALLPSLAAILVADGQHLRRLLLGVAALAVVLAGANARLRAPVLIGGGVLVLVGLHELAQVWDLIPRWIPLAAGGLLLVVLAATLERRRRDLARFRAAITRMS